MNNSSLVDAGNGEVRNQIPSSEYVYVILTAVTSGLSIFGGSCVCVLYFTFKDLRSPGRQLLLFLAFSDAMLALGNLLGIIWYLYSDSTVINKSEGYCDFQSAMTIYFSMTSFTWTVTMATSLFATVVLNKQSFTATYMKLFHIMAWIPAGLITIIALAMDVLGTDTSLEQASWCWIDPRVPNALLWQFVTGKFFEIAAYITTVILYAVIKFFLIRQGKKKIGNSVRRSRRDAIAEANRKLTFVPLVFIVCRIWGTLRFLIGNFGHDIVNEPYVTWINPLQGIGDSAQGFANFVLYCFSTRSIRRRMFPCHNRIHDVTSYNTDSKTENVSTAVKKNAVVPSCSKTETGSKGTHMNYQIFSSGKSDIDHAKSSVYKVSEDKVTLNNTNDTEADNEQPDESSKDIETAQEVLTETKDNIKETEDVTFVIPITSTPVDTQNEYVVLNSPNYDREAANDAQGDNGEETTTDNRLRSKRQTVHFQIEETD